MQYSDGTPGRHTSSVHKDGGDNAIPVEATELILRDRHAGSYVHRVGRFRMQIVRDPNVCLPAESLGVRHLMQVSRLHTTGHVSQNNETQSPSSELNLDSRAHLAKFLTSQTSQFQSVGPLLDERGCAKSTKTRHTPALSSTSYNHPSMADSAMSIDWNSCKLGGTGD